MILGRVSVWYCLYLTFSNSKLQHKTHPNPSINSHNNPHKFHNDKTQTRPKCVTIPDLQQHHHSPFPYFIFLLKRCNKLNFIVEENEINLKVQQYNLKSLKTATKRVNGDWCGKGKK